MAAFAKMNIKIASFIILTGLLFVSLFNPVAASAVAPVVTADCSTGEYVLKLTPPQPVREHNYWYIVIHPQDKPFDPKGPANEYYFTPHIRTDELGKRLLRGNGYNFWVHSISKNRVWSAGVGGNAYCKVREPFGLEDSYSYEKRELSLRWLPVQGAVKYAVRVDNQGNSWHPEAMRPDDWMNDSVQGTSYTIPYPANRNLKWWVIAIDKNNVWSNVSAVRNMSIPSTNQNGSRYPVDTNR